MSVTVEVHLIGCYLACHGLFDFCLVGADKELEGSATADRNAAKPAARHCCGATVATAGGCRPD